MSILNPQRVLVLAGAGALVAASASAQPPPAAPGEMSSSERTDSSSEQADSTDSAVSQPPAGELPASETSPPRAAAAPAGDTRAPPVEPLSEAELLALTSEQPLVEDDRGIDVYGFADFAFSKLAVSEDNVWRNVQHDESTFFVGNFNVYLDAKIAQDWRSLGEVRFTYLPNGDTGLREDSQGTLSPGAIARVDTRVGDYTDSERPLKTGSIEIERVWLEHTLIAELAIRVGSWLTPYGIWNVDHGSPIIIPIGRPFPIGEAFFPERQTGVQLLGSVSVGDEGSLGYHATLSNGRGPIAEYRDLDENKAIGARVFFEYGALGRLKLGVATYLGRYTSSQPVLSVGPDHVIGFSIDDELVEQYDELSYGLDLEWQWRSLHLQGELLGNERAYTEAGRPLELDLQRGTRALASDLRRIGGYFLIGYRTPWWGLMPYALVDRVDRGDTVDVIDQSFAYNLGLNARPIPEIALKLQFSRATFPDAPDASLGRDDLTLVQGQVAWAF